VAPERKRRGPATLEDVIEAEPQLVEVTTRAYGHRLFLPASWSEERRAAWLDWWASW
jgi:hypothetical protein